MVARVVPVVLLGSHPRHQHRPPSAASSVRHGQRLMMCGRVRARRAPVCGNFYFLGECFPRWRTFPKSAPAGARAPAPGRQARWPPRDTCSRRGGGVCGEGCRSTWREDCRQPETVIAPRYAAEQPRFPARPRVGSRTYAPLGAALPLRHSLRVPLSPLWRLCLDHGLAVVRDMGDSRPSLPDDGIPEETLRGCDGMSSAVVFTGKEGREPAEVIAS